MKKRMLSLILALVLCFQLLPVAYAAGDEETGGDVSVEETAEVPTEDTAEAPEPTVEPETVPEPVPEVTAEPEPTEEPEGLPAVESITIATEAGEEFMPVGEQLQLTAVVLPAEAAAQPLQWLSSDESIATVDETGLVTGVAVGEVEIMAASTDGSNIVASYKLTVLTMDEIMAMFNQVMTIAASELSGGAALVNYAASLIGKSASDFGFTTDWCALFVAHCGNKVYPGLFSSISGAANSIRITGKLVQAGNATFYSFKPFDGSLANNYYQNRIDTYITSELGKTYDKNLNKYVENKSSFVPEVGDFILFTNQTQGAVYWRHIGIVESVKNGVVTFIDGNGDGNSWSLSKVGRHSVSLSYTEIMGYVRPNYGGTTTTAPPLNASISTQDYMKHYNKSVTTYKATAERVNSKLKVYRVPTTMNNAITPEEKSAQYYTIINKVVNHTDNVWYELKDGGYVYSGDLKNIRRFATAQNVTVKNNNTSDPTISFSWSNPDGLKIVSGGFYLSTKAGVAATTKDFAYKADNVAASYQTQNPLPCSYNMKTEYKITLQPGTRYYYVLFAKDSNGNTYYYPDANGYYSSSVYFDTEHVHSYSSSVTKQPTCTATGVRTYKCSCGASYTESIAAKGHTEVKDAAVAATCTKAGKTEGKHCSVCGTVTVAQTTIAALGHSNTVGKEAAHPHKEYRKCSRCGYTEYTGNTGYLASCTVCNPAYCTLTYDANGGVAPAPIASMTADVMNEERSTRCVIYTKQFGSSTHANGYGMEVIVDSTGRISEVIPYLGEDGPSNSAIPTKGFVLSCFCNHTYYDQLDEIAVVGRYVSYDPNTLKVTFYDSESCAPKVTAFEGDDIAITTGAYQRAGHKFLGWSTSASATSPTYTSGDRITLNGDMTLYAVWHEHHYSSSVTKQPTCTATGVKTFTCSCGESYTESVPAKGHTEVKDAAVAATCTATGLTEGKHCSVCGTVTVKQDVTEIIPHNFADGECTMCGKQEPSAAQSTITISTNATGTQYPCDVITYTVTLGAIENLQSIDFKLVIPEGLRLVEGSGKVADGLAGKLGAQLVEFTESSKVFTAYGAGHYTSTEDTVLMTFDCVVLDSAAEGDRVIALTKAYFADPDSKEIVVDVDTASSGISIERCGTLTGTFKSFGVYYDMDGKTTLTLERTSGTEKVERTVELDGTVSGLAYRGDWTAGDEILAGAYKLVVSKAGHVSREYTIDVRGNTVQNVEIRLIGDVNGDGRVNSGDCSAVYTHLISDDGTIMDEYILQCANTNGNRMIDAGDISLIYKHLIEEKSLF